MPCVLMIVMLITIFPLVLFLTTRMVEKEYTLPVAIELQSRYLSEEVESTLKVNKRSTIYHPLIIIILNTTILSLLTQFVDGKKPLFKLTTELISTIFTTDKHLNTFFKHYHKKNDQKLPRALQSLTKVKAPIVIQFLPVALNQLFRVMVTQPDPLSSDSFNVLVNMLQRYRRSK